VAFTSRNSQAEDKALVAELTSASAGARCVAHRQEVRNSFDVTRAVEGVIDTPGGLEGAPSDAGVARADMAAHLNDEDPSVVIEAISTAASQARKTPWSDQVPFAASGKNRYPLARPDPGIVPRGLEATDPIRLD